MAYKYLPKQEQRLFDFEVPSFLGYLPKALRYIPGLGNTQRNVEAALNTQGLTLDEMQDVMDGKLPASIHQYITLCERDTSSQPIKDAQHRLDYFYSYHLPTIKKRKEEYVQAFSEKAIRVLLLFVPDNFMNLIVENLGKLGLTVEDAIPLIKGNGTEVAYLNVLFRMAIQVEAQFIHVLDFLEEETGGETEIILRKKTSQFGEKIITVTFRTQHFETGQIKELEQHFPQIINWINDALRQMKARNQQRVDMLLLPDAAIDPQPTTPILLLE